MPDRLSNIVNGSAKCINLMADHLIKTTMVKEIELLDALFQHANEGILISDYSGRIVLANPKVCKLFGYQEEEMRTNKIEDLIPMRFRPHHPGLREEFTREPVPRAMGKGRDLYALKKDGTEFPIEISLSQFSTSDGKYILSFLIDITIRKNQEQEIVKLNEELEKRVSERTEELAYTIQQLAESKQEVVGALEKERQLNELKSRFVTTASHEFRTPLTTILSSVSLISRYIREDENDKRLRHVHKIKAAVSNLTHILNDFLSLGRLEEGLVRNELELLKLNEVVEMVIDELKDTTKEGQTFQCNFDPNNNTAMADQQILKNLLINLVSNAIKYSPEGKPIEIATSGNDQEAIISICDHGIGIPEEDQEFLFQRFFRARNATNIQGTGLGLNIVKRYVELLDGKIEFTSKLNEGTCFSISIRR